MSGPPLGEPEGRPLNTSRKTRLVAVGIAMLLAIHFAPAASAVDPLPIAMNARTGALYPTIQGALDAAAAGDTISVVMSDGVNPTPYLEALTIARNDVRLCATVALGACAPISAPGRWQNSATTWGAPPVAFQGEALNAGALGSTSFFPSAQPGATPMYVSDVQALSFNFLLASGSCGAGGLRFQFRLETPSGDKTVFAYPGSSYTCTVGAWKAIDVMQGGTWGLGAIGGPSAGASKATADALTAGLRIKAVNLVFDGAPPGSVAWFDNKRINDAVFREQVDMACLDENSPSCVTVIARPSTILDSPAGSTATVLITGSGVTLEGFTIKNTGATQGVRFNGAGATVIDNEIVGNGPLSGTQFGVRAAGAVGTPWLIANNTIRNTGHTGVYVSGQSPGKIADNDIRQHRANAIYVDGSTGLLTVERNDLTQSAQANLRVASTRPLLLRDNVMGVSEFTMDFTALLGTVDARYNHWGAYSRADIEATMNDEGTGRVIDISCYYSATGVPVCPPTAAFTFSPNAPHIQTAVQFTDASTAGGNAIESRAWDFGDGATSAATHPTHAFATSGVKTVTLTLTDSEGFTSTASAPVTVSNTAPVLHAVGTVNGAENAQLTFALTANDPDGDALTYSATGLPAGATLNAATGVFSWKPTFSQAGAHEVTFRATDGDLSSSQLAIIEIANVDRAPTLGAIGDRNLVELSSLVVPLSASDPDGDAVTLTASGLPGWATLTDGGNGAGTISGTPGVGARGSYPVTVTATAAGLTAQRSFTITVTPSAGLQLVVVGDPVVHTSPGETVTLTARVTNGGAEPDTFTFALTNSRGWPLAAPATSNVLGPGESELVTLTLVAPAKSERNGISLKATSTVDASKSKTVVWSVDTPITISWTVVGQPSVLTGAEGLVTVQWLDGSAASGLAISATQTPRTVPLGSTGMSGLTDENGELRVVFDDLEASMPGQHTVTLVHNGHLRTVATGSYSVGAA